MSGIFERRATRRWGKLSPALRVAAKTAPYFVFVLDGGPATIFVLRLVWRAVLASNAACARVNNRL